MPHDISTLCTTLPPFVHFSSFLYTRILRLDTPMTGTFGDMSEDKELLSRIAKISGTVFPFLESGLPDSSVVKVKSTSIERMSLLLKLRLMMPLETWPLRLPRSVVLGETHVLDHTLVDEPERGGLRPPHIAIVHLC